MSASENNRPIIPLGQGPKGARASVSYLSLLLLAIDSGVQDHVPCPQAPHFKCQFSLHCHSLASIGLDILLAFLAGWLAEKADSTIYQ